MSSKKSEEELKAYIESYLKHIKERESRWDKILPDKIKGAFYGLGMHSRGIAVNNAVLGNHDEARSWFKKSAEYYFKSMKKGINEVHLVDIVLKMSVLSEDNEQMVAATSLIDNLDSNKPVHLYTSVLCLGMIMQRRDKEALTFAEKLVEIEPRKTSYLKYFKNLGKAYTELIKGNKTEFEEGISGILKRHKHQDDAGGGVGFVGEISIPATVLIALTRNRGPVRDLQFLEERYKRYIPQYLGGSAAPEKIEWPDEDNLKENEIVIGPIYNKGNSIFLGIYPYDKKKDSLRACPGFLNNTLSTFSRLQFITKKVYRGEEEGLNKFDAIIRIDKKGIYAIGSDLLNQHTDNTAQRYFTVVVKVEKGRIIQKTRIEQKEGESRKEFSERALEEIKGKTRRRS